MNTEQLIKYMNSGATLRSHWKPRSAYMKPKFLYTLTLPDGTRVDVQASNVHAAIKRGAIHTAHLRQGGEADFEV